MSKFSGFSEQYDGGKEVVVQQEGAHVLLSVEAESGARHGVVLLTPAQARSVSAALLEIAERSDEVVMFDGV